LRRADPPSEESYQLYFMSLPGNVTKRLTGEPVTHV